MHQAIVLKAFFVRLFVRHKIDVLGTILPQRVILACMLQWRVPYVAMQLSVRYKRLKKHCRFNYTNPSVSRQRLWRLLICRADRQKAGIRRASRPLMHVIKKFWLLLGVYVFMINRESCPLHRFGSTIVAVISGDRMYSPFFSSHL